jgi:hypothetical protein
LKLGHFGEWCDGGWWMVLLSYDFIARYMGYDLVLIILF